MCCKHRVRGQPPPSTTTPTPAACYIPPYTSAMTTNSALTCPAGAPLASGAAARSLGMLRLALTNWLLHGLAGVALHSLLLRLRTAPAGLRGKHWAVANPTLAVLQNLRHNAICLHAKSDRQWQSRESTVWKVASFAGSWTVRFGLAGEASNVVIGAMHRTVPTCLSSSNKAVAECKSSNCHLICLGVSLCSGYCCYSL